MSIYSRSKFKLTYNTKEALETALLSNELFTEDGMTVSGLTAEIEDGYRRWSFFLNGQRSDDIFEGVEEGHYFHMCDDGGLLETYRVEYSDGEVVYEKFTDFSELIESIKSEAFIRIQEDQIDLDYFDDVYQELMYEYMEDSANGTY